MHLSRAEKITSLAGTQRSDVLFWPKLILQQKRLFLTLEKKTFHSNCNMLSIMALQFLKKVFKKHAYSQRFHRKVRTNCVSAPLSGFLGNWLSCRVTIILGGILSSAGLILSSCASSLEQLYICTGVLAGKTPLIMDISHFCLF